MFVMDIYGGKTFSAHLAGEELLILVSTHVYLHVA